MKPLKHLKTLKSLKALALIGTISAFTIACSDSSSESADMSSGISPQLFTDSLFAVMNADRTNYTQLIIARLGPQGAAAITPNEHWEDMEAGAPLPAQMFRFGSEKVADATDAFSYQLKSQWPINSQNGARTPVEEAGLKYISENIGENFYGEEELGGVTYYTAVYPDVAVSDACISCHNNHIDTPRTDFALGDVMGGVVIRVPL